MAKPLLPQGTCLSKGMRKELFRKAYEIQHDISLVFASIVLLAWEVKHECPSHMTLLYQQKLCRNNYADRRFCWLSLHHWEKPNWQQKNSSCLLSRFYSGSFTADVHTVLYLCPHTSTLPQLQAISSFKQSSTLPFLSLFCLYCMLTHHPLSSCIFFSIKFSLIFSYVFRRPSTIPWNTLCNTT